MAFEFLKKKENRNIAAGVGAILAIGAIDQIAEHHPSDAAAEKAFNAAHHMPSAETNISKAAVSTDAAPKVTLPFELQVDTAAALNSKTNDLDSKY